MHSHALDQWLWFFYTLTLAVVVVWTGALFFKRRSLATWFLLAGAVGLALGTLTPSAIYNLGSHFGLHLGYDRYGEKPPHMVIAEIAWRISAAGMVCFQAALWYVLRNRNDSSERIAELEAAIHASSLPEATNRQEPPNP